MNIRSKISYSTLASLLFIAIVSYIGMGIQAAQPQPAASTNSSHQAPASAQTTLQVSTPATSDTPADSSVTSAPVSSSVTSNGMDVAVTVNGQSIDVPENGSVSQTIPTADGNGQTSVSISNSQSTTGQGHNYNFTSTSSSVSSSDNSNSVQFDSEHSSP
jgi:hypothetical protein